MLVTIKDVAKKANVATSTVSKVLKNYSSVSEATRIRVLDAVAELNYIPNSAASALSSKKSNQIALIFNINDQRQSIDEINMQYIIGAFKATSELNLNPETIFINTIKDYNYHDLRRLLLSKGIKFVILFGVNKKQKLMLDIIDSNEFKSVVVDASILFNETTSTISVDHLNGQYEVAKKVVIKGKDKHVLYLAGKEDGYVTDERLAGIKKLQKEYDFTLRVEYADFSEAKALRLTKTYREWADVIASASDLMAIGAMQALIEMDIYRKCCGFDGISLMGYAGKNMYTCKQDFKEIGYRAVYELNNLINGEKTKQVSLPFKVISIRYEDVLF